MRILILLLVAISANSLLANEIHIPNQPDKVVVFRKGAEVTFLFKANLKKGMNTIIIDSMPEVLEAEKINISEKTGLPISSIIYALEKAKPTLSQDDKKIKQLRDSIEDKKELYNEIDNICTVLGDEYNLIKGYKTDNKDFGVEKLVTLTTFYNKRLNEIKVDLAKKRKLQNKLKDTLDSMNSRLTLYTKGKTSTQNMQLKFNIISDNNKNTDFKLVYFTTEAYWKPRYELKVKGIDSNIVISMSAAINQFSKYKWDNVELELSNRSPNKSISLLPLDPIYIENPNALQDLGETVVVAAGRGDISLNMGNIQLEKEAETLNFAAYDNKVDYNSNDEQEESEEVESDDFDELSDNSETSHQAMSIIYKLKNRVSVNFKEDDQTFKVFEIEVPAKYEYYAIPKRDQNAYLLAKIADYGSYNLTEGIAKVYLEGSYIGNTKINPKSIDDTLTIPLGRNEDIQVRKIQLNDFTSTKFLSSKVEQSFGNRISIKNNKTNNINLTIKDQIPVSTFDGAEVKVEEISGAKYDERTGFLTWKVDLDKNEKKELIIKYKVTATSNAIIPR